MIAAAVCAVTALVSTAAAIAATGQPAAASTAASTGPVGIAITGMSPHWAAPGSLIGLTGTVTNTSGVARTVTVQLFGSSVPMTSLAELRAGSDPSVGLLPGADWHSSGLLRAGATASWSVQVSAKSIGMTAFGVYPLAAQAEDDAGDPLAVATTYLPYVPAKTSHGGAAPARQQIAWVWPLMDSPLLDQPWRDDCSGSQASALAASLSGGGRLGRLLAAAAGTGGSALTWAVDPALLANVQALQTCTATKPAWAKSASAWLAELKTATAGQDLFVTPYGDPDTAALIGAGHSADVQRSFEYGRQQAGTTLGRDLEPAGGAAAAGLAWAPGTSVTYQTLENLAAVDGVSTVLLSSSSFPAEPSTVVRTADGVGSYVNLLLANNALTSVLGSAGATAASAFGTAQDFLAETALLTSQDPGEPIVVAPPQRWQPSAGLATQLLAETVSAPWLSPASLASLPAGKGVATVPPPTSTASPAVSPSVLAGLNSLDGQIYQLEEMMARPDPTVYLAVSAIESSAYAGRDKGTALGMLATVGSAIAGQQQGVRIVAEQRIILGGLRGSVPVSIDNHLSYPVQVRLLLAYSRATGNTVTPDPPGVITVPARTSQTVRLRIDAAEDGSTTITMTLADKTGAPIASQAKRLTVQTSQVGTLGMIIVAIALGLLLLASAGRALRRGRPGSAPGEVPAASPPGDLAGQVTSDAEADTVMAEGPSVGAAGPPAPR